MNANQDSWPSKIKRHVIAFIDWSRIGVKGKDLVKELEIVFNKAPICSVLTTCFFLTLLYAGCEKNKQIERLSTNNDAQTRIIEINSATSQSSQSQIQQLNQKILDVKDDKINLQRQLDEVEHERDMCRPGARIRFPISRRSCASISTGSNR